MKKHSTLILPVTIIFTIFLNLRATSQNAVVTVGGEVEKPLQLNAETIKKMNHVTVTGVSHADHKEHMYSGIPLFDIIKESGAIPGNKLKGKYLAKYVLIKGADGYQVVIGLPEIDTAFTDKVIILADEEDGKALSPDFGPYQIVIPGDKKPARCVWHVVSINILTAKLN